AEFKIVNVCNAASLSSSPNHCFTSARVFTFTPHFFSFASNSPLSSNATTVPSKTQQQQAQEHASLCEEASRKFPSLIAESAIVTKIIHVDDIIPLFKGFRIWLSEPSMLSSSLSPGSIVSIITIMFELIQFISLNTNKSLGFCSSFN
ncbi:hypothetical protein VIGAN_05243700, partial [Vigna angularis var. angularis]